LQSHASLEAQVAAVADDIAYDNHDIDDGLRAGLLEFEDLLTLPHVRKGWDRVTARYQDADHRRLRAELVRQQIGDMVNDVIGATVDRIVQLGVETLADVRAAGVTIAGFSDTMQDAEKDHKAFMYARLYHHPSQLEIAATARSVVANLFETYLADPRALPPEWQETLPQDPIHRARHIADFIAGMTDRYAISRYKELVGDAALTEGF
jgi:dGTPase